MRKQLDTARDALEKQPTDFNRQLTKALNDDNVFRSQTVLLAESGPVAGKAACNVLTNAYKNVREVEISRSRIHDNHRETKNYRISMYHPTHGWDGRTRPGFVKHKT
ncbi:hypothetical protein RRG08_028125 [Elysia crispata]|uniref:Uncharacterized protein n=1 Tax=Elysia crispata TaxID=231223 RepID=A0AAE1DS16_9GAST|nr:hypothetical protein RRG08_028125 [Elysia crispata]